MMKILKVLKHRISGIVPKMSLIFIFICILNISVTSAAPRPIPGQEVRPAIFALSKVMMHDVVSPTIASRYYMYATLGAASILSHEGHAFPIRPDTSVICLIPLVRYPKMPILP